MEENKESLEQQKVDSKPKSNKKKIILIIVLIIAALLIITTLVLFILSIKYSLGTVMVNGKEVQMGFLAFLGQFLSLLSTGKFIQAINLWGDFRKGVDPVNVSFIYDSNLTLENDKYYMNAGTVPKIKFSFDDSRVKSYIYKKKNSGDYNSECKSTDSGKVTHNNEDGWSITENGTYIVVITYSDSSCSKKISSSDSKKVYLSEDDVIGETTTRTVDGVKYTVPKDRGEFESLGSQGFDTNWCYCYSRAYALRMLSATTNVTGQLEDCTVTSYGSLQVKSTNLELFKTARDQIVKGYPVLVKVYSSAESSHWIVVYGIKTSRKDKNDLEYSDFLIVDPVGAKNSTSAPPTIINWQTHITDKGDKYKNAVKKINGRKIEIYED